MEIHGIYKITATESIANVRIFSNSAYIYHKFPSEYLWSGGTKNPNAIFTISLLFNKSLEIQDDCPSRPLIAATMLGYVTSLNVLKQLIHQIKVLTANVWG